jgi:NADH:ubiquinone oxidoreductase subunit 6 (subunit J)
MVLRPTAGIKMISEKALAESESVIAAFPDIYEPEAGSNGTPSPYGTTERVSEILFSKYLFPFEAASLLLLAGIIGVVVISRRRKQRKASDEEGGEGKS